MSAVIRLGDPISCGDTMAHGSGNVFANGLPTTRVNVDLTAGHCYSPVPLLETISVTVFVNDIPVAIVGDDIPTHCCNSSCHSGFASNGSPDVFTNS